MINLDEAIVFDIETFPNVFTLATEMLFGEASHVFEISEFRDDRAALIAWVEHLSRTNTPMIAFNSIHFDYPVLHFIIRNPTCTVADIYAKSQAIITSNDRFGHIIWDRDRIAPQIDLFKINHFDNPAKSTSLKALEINMRSERVSESKIPFGTILTREQVDSVIIPYNFDDVRETKRFAHHCMKAIKFRLGLVDRFGVDVLNYNDTKIGTKILEEELGEDVCYQRVPRWDGDQYGRKVPRQTPRSRIALADVIFPYIRFNNPEFQRVLEYMRAQTLTPDDIEDPDAPIRTKGVFSGLHANVGGIAFHFGTGGVHGSVSAQRIVATDEWLIRDIDVAALYPSIAIVNKLAPEHLGAAFVEAYAGLPRERAKHAKGTVENASYKLGSNGAYGNSNNKFSWMFDPRYTMQTTINGQLMLCMLAEWLQTVPTYQIIQINTDGITYRIHRDYIEQAKAIEQQWQDYTLLVLEEASYSRMFIRDVNSYIAESPSKPGANEPPKLKQKGAYWHPTPGAGYGDSISEASPPAWHKDLGNIVSTRAAVAAMTLGIDPETFVRCHSDPFDFMCRARVNRGARLTLDGSPVQGTFRYYVARDGGSLVKVAPPPAGAVIGAFKRAPKVSQFDYDRIMRETGGAWDARIHTQNKSTYQNVESAIEAGYKVADVCDASAFRFDNINYDWYVAEARKLII